MHDIHKRLKSFAINIIKLTYDFPKIPGTYRSIDQIVGSGTSPAANAREANAARSRQEFSSILGIALKELRETHLWLEIIEELQWVQPLKVIPLLQECQELDKIISTIILNAKANAHP